MCNRTLLQSFHKVRKLPFGIRAFHLPLYLNIIINMFIINVSNTISTDGIASEKDHNLRTINENIQIHSRVGIKQI